MINIKLIFFVSLAFTPILAMEQAMVELKANVFEKKYASKIDLDKGNTVFHALASDSNMHGVFDLHIIDELVRRGTDINQVNEKGETAMVIAARNNNLAMCTDFYESGAKDPAGPIFEMLIVTGEFHFSQIDQAGAHRLKFVEDYGHGKVTMSFGRKWFNEKCKEHLLTFLLCLHREGTLPQELRMHIVSFLHHDFFPNCCLPQFFDNEKSEKIRAKRNQKICQIIIHCLGKK